MKKRFIQTLVALFSIFSTFMALGWSFFDGIVHCRRRGGTVTNKRFQLPHIKINHPRSQYDKEYEEGKAWCWEQDMQDCYIRSRDGILLHAYYFPAEKPERYVLLSHGYKGSGFGDFAHTARFLHENNCSLLFIDQRCCGQSGGKYITFGAMEQYDIQKWAFYIARQNQDNLPLYLYGESMGASAILMAAGHRLPGITKGFIADCGFHSMKKQIHDMAAHWFHLHWIELLWFRLNLFCMIFAGFHTSEADTTAALQKNKRPVLFFHGSHDTFVTPENSMINYSICKAPKKLVVIPGARHLCSAYKAEKLYRKNLLAFFNQYDGCDTTHS